MLRDITLVGRAPWKPDEIGKPRKLFEMCGLTSECDSCKALRHNAERANDIDNQLNTEPQKRESGPQRLAASSLSVLIKTMIGLDKSPERFHRKKTNEQQREHIISSF
jgi:hypothetical protein